MKSQKFDFNILVQHISDIHANLQHQATKAINIALTLRNWMIGYYICEYEQGGEDRAEYGENLLWKLSESLRQHGIKRIEERELRRFRLFYLTYPQIRETASPELKVFSGFRAPVSDADKIRETVSPELRMSGRDLTERLSFSHLSELISIEDAQKRYFYEMECIRGNWSVRELKRQISSLYYERCGLSKDPKKLSKLTLGKAQKQQPQQLIRDPYVFEFLGIKSKEVMSESDLEDSLLDKLEAFLMELGHGFCFEARQKRILIGDEYFFIDLVFYHRRLKCNVLIELKNWMNSSTNILDS